MTFPSGAYVFYRNGFPLSLFFDSDNPTSGKINGDNLTDVTWNNDLSEIRFTRIVRDTGEVLHYIGFLFDRQVPNLPPIQAETFVMAGTFTSIRGFENPAKAAAGWGWSLIIPALAHDRAATLRYVELCCAQVRRSLVPAYLARVFERQPVNSRDLPRRAADLSCCWYVDRSRSRPLNDPKRQHAVGT